MAPMSMPSSRLEVATTQGSSPALSSRSTARRFSLETDPWCALAMSAGAPSPSSEVPPMSERMPGPGASSAPPTPVHQPAASERGAPSPRRRA